MKTVCYYFNNFLVNTTAVSVLIVFFLSTFNQVFKNNKYAREARRLRFNLRGERIFAASQSYLMAIQNRVKVEVTGRITRRLPLSP